MELWRPVAESYEAFALEASDSPCFSTWSAAVATDEEVLARIATLPHLKQQPNLVFAAARWHGVPAPGPYAGLREALLTEWEPIRATVLARSTQTNEVGRLATLVPAWSRLPGPLALIEVGASAGLCLHPDRYAYDWSGVRVGSGPVLSCEVEGDAPLPDRPPEVAWRAGLDLHPLDVTDDDATAWLATLVWPEQEERRSRLTEAVAVARREPPYLVAGDAVDDLPDLLARAPEGATPVVFHSAVIAYLTPERRARFAAIMAGLVAAGRCHWVSNEGPRVLPGVTATAPPVPADRTPFVLGLDGRAVGFTHGHGRWLRWFG